MKGIGIQVRQATAAAAATAGKAGQARQWYGRMDGQMDGQTDGQMDGQTGRQTGKCYQGHIQPGHLCGGHRHSCRVLTGVPLHPPPPHSESDALALQ